MEELNKRIPQLPWIIAVVGIVVAGWFFLSASKINAKLNDRQCEMNSYKLRLEQCEKITSLYGRSSDRYYADKPLLILKPEGDKGNFKIYWDSEGKKNPIASWTCSENGKGITIEWGDAFKDHMTNLFVTPGKKVGSYLISLTDNISDDKFQVLVVVK